MKTEYIDTIIIGAGLSGIGAAYHLQKNCPNRSLAILEGRDALGGTWDLFRYPGIRSDSEMFAYSYEFKPWTDRDSLATGEKLLKYLDETATENEIKEKIRFNHKVVKLSWSSVSATWTIEVKVNGVSKFFESNFVLSCGGYYDYEKGYQPEFNNKDSFEGDFIHPQHWPEDLDYTNKKIVIIGSGATAVTLLPNLTKKARHVTMLQRSPTYIVSIPKQDLMLKALYSVLPNTWVGRFARMRNLFLEEFYYKVLTKNPEKGKKLIRKEMDKILSPSIDRKHFTPKYDPWNQRLCTVPDGDLFHALNDGSASVITDKIETFTPKGICLASGEYLEADIVISATGLNLAIMPGIEVEVNNKPISLSDKMFYRGIMLEDVPNFGMVFGYTNSSWTLKSDMVSKYICRVINHMHGTQKSICVPVDTENVEKEPFLNLNSGYVQRAQQNIPKQGMKEPWRLDQGYKKDKKNMRNLKIEDGVLQFNEATWMDAKKSSFITAGSLKEGTVKVASN